MTLLAPIVANMISYEAVLTEKYQSLRESRRIKYMPLKGLSKADIKKYSKDFERWFLDNYGLKYEMVRANAKLYKSLGTSPLKEQYLFGKNGFMYLGNSFDNVVSISTGKNLFSKEELEEFTNNLKIYKNFFQKRGIPAYITIAPNKHTLYPEFLPSYLDINEKTKYDQIIEYEGDMLNIINLRNRLINAKTEYKDLLFYKTDTHWTRLASFIAYSEIIRILKQDFPNLYVQTMNDFTLAVDTVGGDLAYNSNLLNTVNDHVINLSYSTNLYRVETVTLSEKIDKNDPLHTINIGEEVVVINNNQEKCLLFIHDSFGATITDFHQSFGKVVHVHPFSVDMDNIERVVEKYKPDIVLFEFVERYLNRKGLIPKSWCQIDSFHKATPFIRFQGNTILRNLQKVKFLEPKEVNKDFIIYNNKGSKGPWLFFKKMEFPKSQSLLIEAEIYIPQNTVSVIFYNTNEKQNYNRDNSVRARLNKGWNKVYFTIPCKDLAGNLRYDPGYADGTYYLKSFEIRCVQ